MRILFLLLFSLAVNAQNPDHHLTLHVVPSPFGINWETPTSLLSSIQKNRLSFKKRPLGVVFTELKCGDKTRLFTTYYEDLDLFQQLVTEQRGLGVLYHSFPGKFESGDDLKAELAENYKDGAARFISIGLSAEHCQRVSDYISEYQRLNVARHWGLPHDPLKAEGGTSLSFAVSVLEILGFDEHIFREGWLRTVVIPWDKAGPPLRDERINFWKLFNSSWGKRKEKHALLSVWDKEMMHSWLGRNLGNFPTRDHEGHKGIFLDRKHFPVLKTPIWKAQDHLR